MKELLRELYYIEIEKKPAQLSKQESQEYAKERETYELFFNALTDEQKALHLAYEDIRSMIRCKENEDLYQRAFLSGFLFAQELLEFKK